MKDESTMAEPQSQPARPVRENRLAREQSPYLRMHARNPVDWYPWGEEAFERARRERKPLFLSVGYSTCHWCHVMERESFENPEIAAYMNENFVNIKVDREERPDVDRVYMAFVQASTGSGGWPMSVFLTPDLKPFFGGTYWPPDEGYGRPGFKRVLESIAQAWRQGPARVADHASEVARYLEQAAQGAPAAENAPSASILDAAYRQIASIYDPSTGGFGGAPKFPRPVIFNFLLRYYARTGERQALEMTLHTLRSMAAGGMHDHLGGGFHRYSVDAEWHVPHFEKMLYDQAQLAVSYVEAFQITHDEFYARTARGVLDYVLRDMRSPEGGFFTAEDADSLIEKGKPEHGEGAFYIWSAEEIERILGCGDAPLFAFYYDVQPNGNVPSDRDPQGEFQGKNILRAVHSVREAAERFGASEAEIEERLAPAREKLLAARNGRPRPGLDDKILAAWNGLVISAFARAAAALGDSAYLQAARAAADFMRRKLFDSATGSLRRRYREGHAAIGGFLDDYAYLVQGLLDLYESGFEVADLVWAIQLQKKQDELFWDAARGGYFSTPASEQSLPVRMRDSYDGAEPSGNSVAALNLLRLAQFAGREDWSKKAEQTFAFFGRQLELAPESMPQMAVALGFLLSPPRQIVIAGPRGRADTEALLRAVNERFIPSKILLLVDGENRAALASSMPFVEGMSEIEGRAAAYVCENFVCKLPVTHPTELALILKSGG
jgi:uncharacterized protein